MEDMRVIVLIFMTGSVAEHFGQQHRIFTVLPISVAKQNRHMTTRGWIAGIAGAAVLVAGTVVVVNMVSADDAQPQWLFSLSGESAEFVPNGDGTYLMTVNAPDTEMIWFTDRPDREAYVSSTDSFVKWWEDPGNSFDTDPPNATVTDHDRARDPAGNIALTLSDPQLTDGQIVFTVTPLGGSGESEAILQAGIDNQVSLFVDHGNCNGVECPPYG